MCNDASWTKSSFAGSGSSNWWLQWFSSCMCCIAKVFTDQGGDSKFKCTTYTRVRGNSTICTGWAFFTCMEASSGKFALLKRGIGFQPRASSTSPWRNWEEGFLQVLLFLWRYIKIFNRKFLWWDDEKPSCVIFQYLWWILELINLQFLTKTLCSLSNPPYLLMEFGVDNIWCLSLNVPRFWGGIQIWTSKAQSLGQLSEKIVTK